MDTKVEQSYQNSQKQLQNGSHRYFYQNTQKEVQHTQQGDANISEPLQKGEVTIKTKLKIKIDPKDLANPSMKDNLILQKINKSVYDTLSKAYHNSRILPTAVKQYLEDKYGKPVMAKEAQTIKNKEPVIPEKTQTKSNQKLEKTTDVEHVFHNDEKY